MAEATAIILNPKGNHSRDGRQWMAAQRACLRELAPAEVTVVESPQEAAQAAHQSALQGCRKIVTVGDSRTAYGVVNGIMELAESHRAQLRVGFLSLSRPDLWSRTLELPRSLSRQLQILSAGHTLPFDVGRVDCQRPEGGEITRHFLNGASFGVTGHLKREWRNPETNLLQTLPRLAEALRDATSPRGPRVRLECRDAVLYEGDCALAMLMGGRYYPAFGHIAPHADPSDGLLELAWLGGQPWWELAFRLAGLWLGPMRPHAPGLRWQSVERVRAVSLDGPVYVEVDGQPIGRLPATFSVVPRALPVIVEPVAVKLRKPNFTPVEKMTNGRLVGNIKSAAGM
jgi:diacylglycerol kinase family enzyme